MRQVYIDNDRFVREVIPEFNPAFPGIPIEQRYSKEFLDHCLEVPDVVKVEPGMEFLPLKNAFAFPLTVRGDMSVSPGETFRLIFSEKGKLKNVEGKIISRGDTVYEVPANAEGTIRVRFTDVYDRTLDVSLTVEQPIIEPVPASENGTTEEGAVDKPSEEKEVKADE